MKFFYQKRNETYFSKITINNAYPAHLHREIELFYCKSGFVKVTVEGKQSVLFPGDLILIFPDQVHHIQTIGQSTALLCIFSVGFLGDFEHEFYNLHPEDSCVIAKKLTNESRYLLEQLEKQLTQPNHLSITRGYLTALIALLLADMKLIDNRVSNDMDSCKLILNYIHNHFTNELTLDLLSKELGLSKYHISHIFSNKLGMSFSSYVNQERAEYAQHLLKNRNLTITDVCFQSGFNSTRTFYRTFQEIYHMTPLQLRKLDTK